MENFAFFLNQKIPDVLILNARVPVQAKGTFLEIQVPGLSFDELYVIIGFFRKIRLSL
jgi:hypothetical protein